MTSRRWHRPGWFAIVLTLAAIAAFVRLGVWQLDRAEQKVRLFAAFHDASAQPTVSLVAARANSTLQQYPHVQVTGHYDARRVYVLDDQVRNGHVGVMIFDVFAPTDGTAKLLVDEGFLGFDSLPPPALAQQGVIGIRAGNNVYASPPDETERTIDGLYAPPPASGLRPGGNPLPAQSGRTKRSIYIDTAEIGADLGEPLDAKVLLLAPVASGPGSEYIREWTPNTMLPERHRGYAFTWFVFALTALIIFVALHFRKAEK